MDARSVPYLTAKMPIFAYQCRTCGHGFDALQKLNAEPLRICPECGEHDLRKLISAPNLHLSGRRSAVKDQQGPKKKPRFVHTLDSPQPHAEHHSHSHDHKHDHTHKHKHDH